MRRNMSEKQRLSLLRIIEMNIGFFGLQFSFGLQQANMESIYGSSTQRKRRCRCCGWQAR
jgi:maltose/moltooligosaccharide transporter